MKLFFNRKEGEFLDNVAGKLCKVDIESKKSSDVCIPQFSGYGGRPAGCQVDKENAIWIADMRLGLLKWFDGKCIQVVFIKAFFLTAVTWNIAKASSPS